MIPWFAEIVKRIMLNMLEGGKGKNEAVAKGLRIKDTPRGSRSLLGDADLQSSAR